MNLKHLEKYEVFELSNICENILSSPAFERLERISFLGILSPRYHEVFFESGKNSKRNNFEYDDGSRRDHSIGVALQLLKFASNNGLSKRAQKYAVCYGLLHDIATWPLSHTSEPAFTKIFKKSSNEIRAMMILGTSEIPEKYRLNSLLRKINVTPEILVELFNKNKQTEDKELSKLWNLVHSPLTPDTFEGIWRLGKVYKIKVPNPNELSIKLNIDPKEGLIIANDLPKFVKFWKIKSRIYEKVINSDEIIKIESSWSNSILQYYHHLSLSESFDLSESELLDKICESGLIESNIILRYKSPKIYFVDNRYKLTSKNVTLDKIKELLKNKNKTKSKV